MVLYSAVTIALVVALLFGGKLSRLGRIRLRAVPLAIAAAVCTKFIYASGYYHQHPVMGPGLWLACLMAAAVFLWLNRAQRPLIFAAVGSLCNVAVIAANRGEMPTGRLGFAIFEQLPTWFRQPGLNDFTPGLWADSGTPLRWLGDVIPPIIPYSFAFSIGDVLVAGGVIWLLMGHMFASDVEASSDVVPGIPVDSGSNELRTARTLRQIADMVVSLNSPSCERVAQVSARIAASIVGEPAFTRQMYLCGLLHDVGELALEQLVEHSDPNSDVAVCTPWITSARTHVGGPPECPTEAAGDLPRPAQVLAAATAFERLTSDSPQRRALSVEAALDEMAHCGQYDSEIMLHLAHSAQPASPSRAVPHDYSREDARPQEAAAPQADGLLRAA